MIYLNGLTKVWGVIMSVGVMVLAVGSTGWQTAHNSKSLDKHEVATKEAFNNVASDIALIRQRQERDAEVARQYTNDSMESIQKALVEIVNTQQRLLTQLAVLETRHEALGKWMQQLDAKMERIETR